MSDEELDDLFRRSAEGYEPPYDPEDWKDMNRRLDSKPAWGTSLRRWLPALLLALLLGVVTIWKLADTQVPSQEKGPNTTENKKVLITQPTQLPERRDAGTIPASPQAKLPTSPHPLAPAAPTSPPRIVPIASGPVTPKTASVAPLRSIPPVLKANEPTTEKHRFESSAAPLATKYKPAATAPDSTARPPEAEKEEQHQEKVFQKHITLALVVAPDITSVRFRDADAVSMNAGLLVSLPLTRRLSLVTGAVNASKRYNTNARDYEPYPGFWDARHVPEVIAAKCQVLDIPLNLQYQVLERGRYALTVQAGFSSYLMLNEKYTYRYGGPQPYTRDMEVSNENRHWFGVQNLSVGYTHQLSPLFSIGVEPFVKIPLAAIGEGHVKLTSAGVFLKAGYMLR